MPSASGASTARSPHIDMWYDAFGVKPGDKMYLPKNERLELW